MAPRILARPRATPWCKSARLVHIAVALPAYRVHPERFSRWLRGEVEQLGAVYTKLGQWVSSRKDVFPAAVADAFAALQSDVRPMDAEDVERALAGSGLTFESFDFEPVSSGSIAQVHRAVYCGLDVAVKIQRPRLLDDLDDDLRLVRRCLLPLKLRNAKSFEDATRSLDDLVAAIRQETDFAAEAEAMERFRSFYAGRGGSDGMRVPRAYVATPEVLVMEFVASQPVRADCERLMRMFCTQFFELGSVHTDLHAGNMGVDAAGRLVLYDFGSTLRCPEEMRTCVKRLFVGFLNRNPAVMLEYLTRHGVLTSHAPLTAEQRRTLEAFVGAVLRYVETTDIRSFGEGVRGIPVPSTLPAVELQPEVFMAFRSFTLLEGLCKQIDPAFSILDAMTPYALSLLSDPEVIRFKIEDDIANLRDLL